MGSSFLRAEARAVFARYRIDLALLRVGAYGDVLRLQGTLKRSAGLPQLTHEALENLELELRRIRGVRRVEMHLSNWTRHESLWRPVTSRVLEAEPTVEILPTRPVHS